MHWFSLIAKNACAAATRWFDIGQIPVAGLDLTDHGRRFVTQQPQETSTPSDAAWTVRRVLEWTTNHLKKYGSDTPRLDAEILLAHARGCQRIQLYTQFDELLSDAVRAQMRELVQRRAKSEPVAYLVGQREFFSLRFQVNRDVLIPRPDTETLVMEVLDAIKTLPEPKVLDLCTGSGCVAIAVAKNSKKVEVTATDISTAAITVARVNAEYHKVTERTSIVESDLFACISPEMKFDVIASNPPYIPSAEIDKLDAEVSKHEPRMALDGGPDGLDILRRIVTEAPKFAAPNAWLLLEFTPEQAEALESLVTVHGAYDQISIKKDLGHRARVLKARMNSNG